MKRSAMAQLVKWKNSSIRKPLVVKGARQVGKTWLVKEFARQHFKSIAHITFMGNEQAKQLFSGDLNARRLLMLVGALTDTSPLDTNTLVFFDEIQECPRAIAALKLFAEQVPEIPIVAAGSLLGVALKRDASNGENHTGTDSSSGTQDTDERASWPVGKVSFLDLHPLTFSEFVRATASEQLADMLVSGDKEMLDLLSEQLRGLLSEYLFVGGMPEVVAEYARTKSLAEARRIQQELLRGYELDFSKHVPNSLMTERIRQTWRSVPAQLARESDLRRFAYASIRTGARGRDYRDAVAWLVDAGLVTRVFKVSKPHTPLSSYTDDTYFKLYFLDVGLLGAATHIDARVLLEGDRHFTEYKGVYAEQFVCQHLVALSDAVPLYWSADGKSEKGEVDFIVERDGMALPIEVKAQGNVTGGSISRFCKRYGIERALRFSLLGYRDEGWITNVPLYSIECCLH